MVLDVKLAEIFEKNPRKTPFEKNTKKAPRIRKNENFENRASTCFKLAQMTPAAKISLSWDHLVAEKNVDKQTDNIHVF